MYSARGLRQAFAARLYRATHDIYQVEKALGHANVGVTEHYLRSLGEETDRR
jgi:integrase